jgi:hypothetical protein
VTTLALELNDAGLVAVADTGPTSEQPVVSPGFALVDGERILTGSEALDGARLTPRRVHSRFWSNLDGGNLGRPFGRGLTHADLAHDHLSRVWRLAGTGIDRVILAVPGAFSEHQLGLLLGIARAAQIPVQGLVDSALAAAATGRFGRHLIHIDLRLHDAVLTELILDVQLTRRRVQLSDFTGSVPLRDALAKYLAGLFVRRTRFDPLHAAPAEQALYAALDPLLDGLRESDRSTVELDVGRKLYSVEVTREEIRDAIADVREGLADLVRRVRRAGERATLLLSHRVAGVPGLADSLRGISDTELVVLPHSAAADGALMHQQSICTSGQSLPYVTRLALGGAPSSGRVEAAAPKRSRVPRPGELPTHLLLDGRAYSIDEVPLWVGSAVAADGRAIRLDGPAPGISRKHCGFVREGERVTVKDNSTHGTFLNGHRVDGEAALFIGDRLQIGAPAVEFRMIRVVDREAAPTD